MAIYEVKSNDIIAIQETDFASQGLKEREDLQRLLKKKIDIISEDTLVIAEEFGGWEESRRRIDLLGIDKNANIVVIELKRTEDGGHMELQAIRYAAMLSTLTFDKVVEIYGKYIKENNIEGEPREMLLEFLEWDEEDEEEFGQDVRIVLASSNFSKELTTAVMWLNERDLDIRCVRMKPYKDSERTLLDVQTVIPLPEVEEYQIQIKEKQQKERASRKTSNDLTHYQLTIDNNVISDLPKRWLAYHVFKAVVDSGIHPTKLQDAIPWKRNSLFLSFDGELDEDEVYEKIMETDSGGKIAKPRRFYSKEGQFFHVEGKTYIFTNQWGRRALEAMHNIKDAFPELKIKIQPQD